MANIKTLPQTVACYCRVSTENQIENYSIDEQRERLEAFCKAKGWNKPEMFIDPGFSGGSLERPALRSLLDDVKRGKFGTVVVYKLDRLSRSQKDTLYLIEDVFNKCGVNFVSVCENFDTGTPVAGLQQLNAKFNFNSVFVGNSHNLDHRRGYLTLFFKR